MNPDQLEQYREPLMRYALKLYNSDVADAEDAVQETFLKACFHIGEFQNKNPQGWLSQILHNHAVTNFRRKKTGWSTGGRRWGKETTSKVGVEVSEYQIDEDLQITSREASPVEMANFNFLNHKLDEFLNTLNNLDKKLFKEVIEGVEDQRALAIELGLTPGTMRTRLCRIREHFEKFLNAPVAQSVGGTSFKTKTVWVRIPPGVPKNV